MRKIALALALFLGLANGAAAQAPSPVPALPDSARITTYSISASTCTCSVGFAIYGSGSDVDAWIQVSVNGVVKLSTDPTSGWSLSSVNGSLASIPRPITNAVLTFNSPQTATVIITGNERPRRLSQFPENRGVAARDLNQAITDLVAVQRELWDKSNLVGVAGGFPGVNVPYNWSALHNFMAGVTLTGPGPASQLYFPFYVNSTNSCTQGCGGLLVAGTLAGTQAGGIFFNDLAINSDNVALTNAGASLSALYVLDTMNGAALRGYRNGIFADIQQTVISANVANGLTQGGNYVAITARSETSSGDGGSGGSPAGGYWGINTWCGNKAAALSLYICTGGEFDNYGLASATQKYKFGINIADGNGSTAITWDSAIAIYTLGANATYPQGRGWECALCLGNVAAANIQPLSATSTIFGTHIEAPMTQVNVAKGIDWSSVVFSGNAINTAGNFVVGNAGDVLGRTATLTAAAPTVAAARIGYGSTTVAAGASTGAGTCPTGAVGGATTAGCIIVNIAGTQRGIPFF